MELPDILHIEPVGNGRRGAPVFMAFDAFCRVLDPLAGLRRLHFGGAADPLLHPRFFDMVRRAARRGIEVSADTALTGLSDARADLCVESGLQRVILPAGAPEVVLRRYLRRLAAARSRADSVTPEVRFPADRAQSGGRCDRPSRAVYIATTGEALPCDHARGPLRPAFGNMAREGVLQVWSAEAFREFRRRLASGAPPELCAACELRDVPLDLGDNAAWSASPMPPLSAPSSTTAPAPTAG